jgi:hypothetical protein
MTMRDAFPMTIPIHGWQLDNIPEDGTRVNQRHIKDNVATCQ